MNATELIETELAVDRLINDVRELFYAVQHSEAAKLAEHLRWTLEALAAQEALAS